MLVYYEEKPRVSYRLESSFKFESKTKQVPFVVASEVDRDNASREFLVFHDVKHFLSQRTKFPHCHEIIKCKDGDEEFSKGRLIFDFDLDERLENAPIDGFVPGNFNEIVEFIVIKVFEDYYKDININKLQFIWQVTKYKHKFSKHLIVKNAYFSEFWVKQVRVFYEFFRKIAKENGYDWIIKTIDFQIARKNATFRMIGCSKIGGKPLELESPVDASFFDCLAGIYEYEVLKNEQCIRLYNIDYSYISEELEIEEDLDIEYKKAIHRHIILDKVSNSVDVSDEEVQKCIDIFNNKLDMFGEVFRIRDIIGNTINLNRIKSCECPISGIHHDRENAYLKMCSNGHLVFYCRRGCSTKNNKYGLDLGVYSEQSKNKVFLDKDKLNMVLNSKTKMKSTYTPINFDNEQYDYSNCSTSAKRIAMRNIKEINIPKFLIK